MRKALLVLAVFGIVYFVPVIEAQTQAPKLDPALQKLRVLVGHWTYKGEYKAGPLGPGGKITGVYDCRPVLGGFFLEAEQTEKGVDGETHNIEIDAYDPVSKNFTSQGYQSDGSTWSGVIAVEGKTITWNGKWFIAGKPYPFKMDVTFASDSMNAVEKLKISTDGGKTWVPLLSSKWFKAAAKK